MLLMFAAILPSSAPAQAGLWDADYADPFWNVDDIGALVDLAYPDRVVDPRGTVNGCGSQGENGTDVPDEWFGVSFTEACDWHDLCYGTEGIPKQYCDDGMLARNLEACGDDIACAGVARAYYMGLGIFGDEPYASGQREAAERNGRPPRPNRTSDRARIFGDPHLVTFDGLGVNFQYAGVFELLRDPSGLVAQIRTFPAGDRFSLTTGIAVRLGDHIISVETHRETHLATVYLDGEATTGRLVPLPEGLIMSTPHAGSTGGVTIRRNDGLTIDLALHGDDLDLSVLLPVALTGQVSGLLGDGDGDPANDIVDIDGNPITAIDGALEAHPDRRAVATIRVAVADSWFVDSHGFDYHAPDLDRYPVESLEEPENLDALLDAARATCEAAGIDERDLHTCAFDVVFGGDAFAGRAAVSAARIQPLRPDAVDVNLVEPADACDALLNLIGVTTTIVWGATSTDELRRTFTAIRDDAPTDLRADIDAITEYNAAVNDLVLEYDGDLSVVMLDPEAAARLTSIDATASEAATERINTAIADACG